MTEKAKSEKSHIESDETKSFGEEVKPQVNTTETDEDQDLSNFLNTLKNEPNEAIGNQALRQKLGWDGSDKDRARYWATHGRALDKGVILKGKGKGGSVRLALVEGDDLGIDDAPMPHETTPSSLKETSLYPPALKVIEDGWVKSANYDDYLVEITAAKGRAATGGKWSRPDISVLATKSYPFLPSRQFDIVTFEIKPAGQTDVEGVFEALSHQQFASKSYVIFHLPSLRDAETFSENQAHGDRILGTARKHGVGIIVASHIDNWESWDELLPAERYAPDPEQANRFIATCFTEKNKEQIIKWHK